MNEDNEHIDHRLRTSGLTWHTVGSDLIILDLDGSVYMKLNGSACVLWETLAEPAGLDELAAVLVAQYGIDDERARADARQFLDDLRTRGLLDE